jgi:23S rRNA (pseudouridine1915-N3)-methyltransferase
MIVGVADAPWERCAMKIAIHAVGRLKAGAEKELCDRYLDRFARSGPSLGLEYGGVTEIVESRLAGTNERRREESARLMDPRRDRAALILLDERGRSLASTEFAAHLGRFRDDGFREAVFAIGGPDGHDPSLRGEAALTWSFGALTWPHQLVRIMLAEQLYRAVTILSGHPYHRE